MKHVKAVIGANFGDEGKGLVTSALTKKALGKTLNVLYNGGNQRGHTVQKDFSTSHVFHSLGSGSFYGADTYYDKEYIVEPLSSLREFQQFPDVKVFANENCRITTFYDIAVNQQLEIKRSNNRHGSCGMGIFETRKRSESFPLFLKDLYDDFTFYRKLKYISEVYYPKRCKELGITPELDISFDYYMREAHYFAEKVTCVNSNDFFRDYDTVIYEGAQGLLLSEDNVEYWPNLTPSYTGSKYIADYINSLDNSIDVEVCYVSRGYMTRHGAGKFLTECKREELNPMIIDRTNETNKFQGTIRYGYLDLDLLERTIKKDLQYYKRNIKSSVAFTQLNYTDGKLLCGKGKKIPVTDFSVPNNIYTSIDKQHIQ